MGSDEIELEFVGAAVELPRDVVRGLAAAAARRAGLSTQHRDLSLVLGRALETGSVTLRAGEARALGALLEEQQDGFGAARAELLRLTSGAQP